MPRAPGTAANLDRRQRTNQCHRGAAAGAGIRNFRNANFAAYEHTEVNVEFVPATAGTLVTVTHRGLSGLRADHPARHGLQGADFSRMIGLWWGEQMTALRDTCAAKRPGAA